jgi:sugar/nucleoside kinase (ribokinase family)
VNVRPPFDRAEVIVSSLPFANILKVNEAELDRLSAELDLTGRFENRLDDLMKRFSYRFVALTLGAKGSAIMTPAGIDYQPARHAKAIDPVGAGDNFVAALCAGLLKGWTVDAAHALAADVASFVVSQVGATPELPEEFTRRLELQHA